VSIDSDPFTQAADEEASGYKAGDALWGFGTKAVDTAGGLDARGKV